MRRMHILLILILVLSGISFLSAQNIRGMDVPEAQIADEYEDAVRDLVDRYEELRILFREQIQINADLYSEEEMNKMTAELRAQVASLQTQLDEMTFEFKRALEAVKEAEEYALAHKNRLIKERGALTEEVDTLEALVDRIEEERLFTVGAGFSRDGYLSAIGMFNLPGTNLSMYGEGNYQFRSQDSFISMGVAFQILPQRTLVEGWERFRRRMASRRSSSKRAAESEDDKNVGESTVGELIGDALDTAPADSRTSRGSRPVEDSVPTIP